VRSSAELLSESKTVAGGPVPRYDAALLAGYPILGRPSTPFSEPEEPTPPSGPGWWAKLVTDRLAALVCLVLLLPVFLLVAVAIRLESRGPVFFRQRRVGRHGRQFEMWKFRSMVVDAEDRLAELEDLNEAAPPYFKMRRDPRVTRVGAVLRRFYIDELPQLINVLKGEMSLVGPRPILPREFWSRPDLFSWRLPFQPGMTGLWQVTGRSWLTPEAGARIDRHYFRTWTYLSDLRLLLRTAWIVCGGDRVPADLDLRYPEEIGTVAVPHQLVAPHVSVVVVAHDSARDIADCLRSLEADVADDLAEVIVVDNASTDGTADLVAAEFPWVRLVRKVVRHGFATNCNLGSYFARGRYLMLLNPDATLAPGSLATLASHLERHPSAGAVAPSLTYPDGSPQPSARRFPTLAATLVRRTPLRQVTSLTRIETEHLAGVSDPQRACDVDWVLGAALMFRAQLYQDMGGLDEGYRLYCEDIDVCWRLHQWGLQVHYLPEASGTHRLSELTRHRLLTRLTWWHLRSMLRFLRVNGLGVLGAGQPARPLLEFTPSVEIVDELVAAAAELELEPGSALGPAFA